MRPYYDNYLRDICAISFLPCLKIDNILWPDHHHLHNQSPNSCYNSSGSSLLASYLPSDIECTIAELENDCDTLENEANRLLAINRELRVKMGEEPDEELCSNFL